MNTITDQIVNVINQTEIVAIATVGEGGPHMVATWGEFVAGLGVQDGHILLVPAGGYHQTEINLKANDSIALLVGSKNAPGKSGSGTGYRLMGKGMLMENGKYFDLVKEKYSWARAALVVEVETAEQLL